MAGLQRLPGGLMAHAGLVRAPCFTCCGQGPCGNGGPSCCITNPRPPGCVSWQGTGGTPRLDRWTNGIFTQSIFPPDRNCCCGPAAGRVFTIEREEIVYVSTGYPEILQVRGWVRLNAVGVPDVNGRIPYTRETYDAATGLTTADSGLASVVTPGTEDCDLDLNLQVPQFPPPGFGFPTCTSRDIVGEPGGTGIFSCVPKDGFRFFECYHEELDLWSEIRLTLATGGSIPQGVSHSRYRYTLTPNNAGCVETGCPARGACCCGGLCFTLTAAECAAQRGAYLGDGSTCYGASCYPIGQCCLPGNQCADTDRATCYRLGGFWNGRGTSCRRSPPCSAALPAKCCLPSGVCTHASAQACQAQGGTYSPGEVCGPIPCQPQSTGACCLVDGSCAQVTVGACAAQNGTWNGEGSNCGSVICDTGACCVPTSHGWDCTIATPAGCLAQGGTYRGNGVPCTPDPCGPRGALWVPPPRSKQIVVPAGISGCMFCPGDAGERIG